jgi:4-oxalocrotonate tautomerase
MPFINVLVSHRLDQDLARRIAEGVSERTVRILRKSPQLTAAAVSFVPDGQWLIGGRRLEETGASSYQLAVTVTAGTNTPAEKAAYLAEIHTFMADALGGVRPESYAVVHEVPADAWGFGGITQAARRSAT